MSSAPPDPPPQLLTREELEQRERSRLHRAAVFSAFGHERPMPEERDPYRTCYVRDRDRVLHAGAFRRLKAKTQVFVIDEGDFYRTRLTHTLEVVQLARYLARALRLNESIAEVLALVHDIGHPPFGHEGERWLDTTSGVRFDHNAQALRIVDVLEEPYADRQGLNLTQLVRRMILKHGGEAGRGAAPTRGHVLEAQLTDLADRIAYQHHDLEDGVRAGILRPDDLQALSIWRASCDELGAPTDRQSLKAVLNHMLKASLADVIAVSARNLAESDVRDAADVEQRGQGLVAHGQERARMHSELGRFLFERFYRHPRVLRSSDIARGALATIAEHYRAHLDELPAAYQQRLEQDGAPRTICDYVAGMTDRFAMDEAQRLAARRTLVAAPAPDADARARLARLEETIHHVFRDPTLGVTALTHASARTDERAPNERLEFLGDAVLGLVIAEELYLRFPDHAEGELSRMKSGAVKGHALSAVADGWGLADLLILGPGFREPGDVPPSLVADAVEAVIGAVYLDGQLEAAKRLIHTQFRCIIDEAAKATRSTNAKSSLQAFTQGRMSLTPHYQVLGEQGPDHKKQFTVAAVLDGVPLAQATGRNKRQAEQRAARAALKLLREAASNGQELPGGLPHPAPDPDEPGPDDPGPDGRASQGSAGPPA